MQLNGHNLHGRVCELLGWEKERKIYPAHFHFSSSSSSSSNLEMRGIETKIYAKAEIPWFAFTAVFATPTVRSNFSINRGDEFRNLKCKWHPIL